jgi:membrane protein DedA with SNARE-associated domain
VRLLVASITGPLVDFATKLIGSAGLGGILALMTINGVIGLPGTEPTMLFSGFNVSEHHLSLVGIIVAGTVGDVLGASIAYAIAYFGRRELLERQGSRFHLKPGSLDRAERWFERWGAPVVFVSRMLPVVRAAFPYAAGVSEMPYRRFLPLAALGSLIWVTGLSILGRAVGHQWTAWRHHLEYVDYAAAAVVIAVIAWFVIRFVRARRQRSGTTHSAAEPTPDVVPD